MLTTLDGAALQLDLTEFRRCFDREPFGFDHTLSGLDLFRRDRLEQLAAIYADHQPDYYVAGGAPTPGTVFYAVPSGGGTPLEAIRRLSTTSCRVLLKRPENHDPEFRALLDAVFRQVLERRGGLGRERLVRLESTILISSAATTTPFHFDPEIAFFSQIEGEKLYHVYSPTVVSEPDLERFYMRDAVDIGQASLAGCPADREHVFRLVPGKGFHQPQNAPHWVQTGASLSISYSFVFETDVSRSVGQARSFNHYLRKLGYRPAPPGRHPSIDAIKARAMGSAIPLRQWIRSGPRRLLHG
jgi:hypothetical protein